MLKTNSKVFRNKIRNYIIDSYDGSNYEAGTSEAEAQTFEDMAKVILADVRRVEGWKLSRSFSYTMERAFSDWSCGLPSLLDTCYHYNVSAVDLLGDMLEETEEERNRYSESEAESLLDKLIYRELATAK